MLLILNVIMRQLLSLLFLVLVIVNIILLLFLMLLLVLLLLLLLLPSGLKLLLNGSLLDTYVIVKLIQSNDINLPRLILDHLHELNHLINVLTEQLFVQRTCYLWESIFQLVSPITYIYDWDALISMEASKLMKF